MDHIIIKSDECKACYLCVEFCHRKCIVKGNNINKLGCLPAEFNSNKCTACGICFFMCPEPGAITVIAEE